MLRPRPAWILAGLLTVGFPHVAPAQDRDPVAAESLFREGRKALDAGDFVTARSRFAESRRLDPKPGTLLNLARCDEQLGELASAWQLYRQGLDQLAADDDRREFVQERLADLEKRLPKLTIRLARGARADARVA